jgi:hypothetical protein
MKCFLMVGVSFFSNGAILTGWLVYIDLQEENIGFSSLFIINQIFGLIYRNVDHSVRDM